MANPQAKAAWKALFQRQLSVRDHDHAGSMAQVAADIIDGDMHSLAVHLNGIDPNTAFKLDGGQMSMLDLAAAACQLPVVKELYARGAFVDGLQDSTPLVTAAAKGQTEIVSYLLGRGARLEKEDANGHTALEDAIRQRQISSAMVLLDHGDNVNRKLPVGASLLDIVEYQQDPESRAMARALRARGAVSTLRK